MDDSRTVRIALLTEIPAPFRIPLFNALAARDGVTLEVVFLSEHDPRRTYRVYRDEFAFEYVVLPRVDFQARGRWLAVNRGVVRTLRRFRPDVVVVGGWNQPAFWQALAWARRRGVPRVTWVESTARDVRSRSRGAALLRRAALAASSAFLVPGRAAAAYLRSLGAAEERIFVAPNAVDLEIFGNRVAELRKRRESVRSELGLERCTLLYVGRLVPEKDVDLAIEAAAGLDAELVLVGAGPDEERLRRLAAPERVRFVGRLERDELPAWYAAADVLVHPSPSDTWGMSLSEGAAAGLPLVATEAAGAAHDLIDDGVNGFRVPIGDREALAAALKRLCADDAFREAAGRRSLELAAGFTADAWADAVVRVARQA